MLKTMPLWKNAMLHLLPGAAVTLVYLVLSAIITTDSIPKALIFYLSGLSILPVMFIIMKAYSPNGKAAGAVEYREMLPFARVVFFGVIAFLWAALVMVAFKTVNAGIEQNLFGWMAKRFDLTGFATNPGQYPKAMLILTWAVGLATTSALLPVAEEFYFRGFLLSKLEPYKLLAVPLSALLFSMYHLFSPWPIVARFVALLPMTYFVYRTKNVGVGIAAHVLLNLIGDTISTVPIVFG